MTVVDTDAAIQGPLAAQGVVIYGTNIELAAITKTLHDFFCDFHLNNDPYGSPHYLDLIQEVGCGMTSIAGLTCPPRT